MHHVMKMFPKTVVKKFTQIGKRMNIYLMNGSLSSLGVILEHSIMTAFCLYIFIFEETHGEKLNDM